MGGLEKEEAKVNFTRGGGNPRCRSVGVDQQEKRPFRIKKRK